MNTEITEKLCKARNYELIHSKEIPKEQRPVFHMAAPVGWMNDPNGFSMFQGSCHLFFQYHPYSTFWGPMHWGHYTTNDFIQWELKPCALAPDQDYDKDGCFSGTAVEWNGKHVLMYTGVKEGEGTDGTHYVRQTQCIAIGDGENYKKCEKNPVITADMLPEGSSETDFRDPKIWKDEDGFWSLVGSKNEDGSGQLALFFSEDAVTWKFETILDYCRNEYGEMWECPDFFSLDQKQILIISPQFMQADGKEFHSGNNTAYFIGEYDKKSHTWHRGVPHMVDFGLDFYAAETMEAEDGRRIMIAWLQSWDNRLTPDDYAWSGMMTIPRELFIRDGQLMQYPVRELIGYHKKSVNYENYEINQAQKEMMIPEIEGRAVDLTIRLKKGNYTEFGIAVAADEKHRTMISYDKEKGTVCVDRTMSGLKKDFITSRSMKVNEKNGELQMRILIDTNSVEVFVNGGEQAMTTLIYTPLKAKNILWSTDGNVLADIEKHDIVID